MKYHECSRAILGIKRADHIPTISIQKKLGLLSLESFFKFQNLTFVHKIVNNLSPTYCSDMFIQPNMSISTRSHENNYFIPRVTSTTGECALSYWGPKMWLNIDHDLKSLSTKQFHNAILNKLGIHH